MEKGQPIVFAYWKDDKFMGFRADTFNTISDKWPKIYSFSREQIDTVLKGIKSGCNRAGKALAESIKAHSIPSMNPQGHSLNDILLDHLTKTEDTLREWGEFEVRVHPFMSKEEWYEKNQEGEEWKLETMPLADAIEIHKFKVVENEN